MSEDLHQAELDFFMGDEGLLPIYLGLRRSFLQLAPGSEIRVQQTTVSFNAPKPFVYVSHPFRKNDPGWPKARLLISFSATEPVSHPHVIQSTLIRPGLYTIHALVADTGPLDAGLMQMVAYSLNYKNRKVKRK